MAKPVRIKNWLIEEQYGHYFLYGDATAHPKLGDCQGMRTSQLKSIDFAKGLVVTNNRTYKLVGGYKFKKITKAKLKKAKGKL